MTTKIASILVATDLSAPAQLAVERAARVAEEHAARLDLCCAVPMPQPMPIWGDMISANWFDSSETQAATEQQLTALASALGKIFGIQVGWHCEVANAGSLVPAHALAGGYDLLVIGATGEGAISRRVFGSTAQTIVRRSQIPVLVVRKPATASYARLLAATDFSEDAQAAARFACTLAPSAALTVFAALDLPTFRVDPLLGFNATERATHLGTARTRTGAALVDLATRLGRPGAHTEVRDGRPSHELPALIAELQTDLLCIGSHGKSFFEASILGSTSLHLMNEAGCDVLVVPPQKPLQ